MEFAIFAKPKRYYPTAGRQPTTAGTERRKAVGNQARIGRKGERQTLNPKL